MACIHCGSNDHLGQCPLVKSIEYFEASGRVKRVEYFTMAELVRSHEAKAAKPRDPPLGPPWPAFVPPV